MLALKTASVILLTLTHLAAAQVPGRLAYSGETRWDATTATLTFKSSGNMPEGKEEFWWQVPTQVKRIHIEPHVTVRGGFRVPFRTPENPLHIVGGDRKSSVISGTDSERLYNMAPFTWEGGNQGVREVTIKGLKIDLAGKLYDESAHRWVPVGLFKLKPTQCTLNLTVTGAEIGLLEPGIRRTRGTITINGRALP